MSQRARTGSNVEDKTMSDSPCQCWLTSPPTLHSDHCCFLDDPTLEGEVVAGQLPACGHWHPAVPRPGIHRAV